MPSYLHENGKEYSILQKDWENWCLEHTENEYGKCLHYCADPMLDKYIYFPVGLDGKCWVCVIKEIEKNKKKNNSKIINFIKKIIGV